MMRILILQLQVSADWPATYVECADIRQECGMRWGICDWRFNCSVKRGHLTRLQWEIIQTCATHSRI